MICRTLLLLCALPVRPPIAVSANDTTEIMVDGVHVMVPNAAPDTVRLIDLSALAEEHRGTASAVQLVRSPQNDCRDAE